MELAKKEKQSPKTGKVQSSAEIANAGVVMGQPITDTLEKNFMPYAMSVIVSRAIPEIDGFKPAHRKLLYTMYKMGLLTGNRTKSANVVGQTMRLNPHGDAAIYETMVRLARGNEALLVPYVDSKGNFGKAYSRDMAYAASRYTEVKLDAVCNELFRDIDKDTVDFADNYDNTTKEPTLLPATFPTVLVNANVGIAVGMASAICPFNLTEVCDTAIAFMRDESHDLLSTLKAPDFPGGGYILYDKDELAKIYETGRGSVKVRSRWSYDKANNCIEITEIPSTTTIEAIMDKVVDLIKAGKIREISDMRDESDLSGLKITLDLKRGTDPDRLMQKLFKSTPLEDSYACNFNVLIGGSPMVLGVRRILGEWTAFRTECIKRRVFFELSRKKEKLHLLRGLAKILMDIDKAVKIVRETEEEAEVVPNLMIGFGIDEVQAEFVAEIKLRHLNREYILNRLAEVESLEKEISEMEGILADARKVRAIIIRELNEVSKKYGKPRKSIILYESALEEPAGEEEIPDYPVHLFFTKEGYFKKITPQSLRMSSDQKLKEGDEVVASLLSTNACDLLFFTDRGQVYKQSASEFEETKASAMGDFIPAKLGMDEGERAVAMAATPDYKGFMLFFYENGKAAKVDMESYATKTRRKKLTGAYCTKSPLRALFYDTVEKEYALKSTAGRMLLVHSAVLSVKSARDTQGVAVMTLKKNHFVNSVEVFDESTTPNAYRYRTKTLPAIGALIKAEDFTDQLTF